ncbi:alcohol dehydrogenase class IV [Cytobacillus firmus]|uniref:Alcohol dehydrogenase class IV n=2 Tax=Cytobacillus TaxID=2675230 RepID=A0A366JR24_CYTFI|nr:MULTISPECIES: iron-containing alcohol dehydrogenase [Cytobacillus]RBP90683.1 alcohol dehydrogenase class IV [Cytobacillus firmus]TDX46265.1 alcohol dehydrogenase class IV [Cytobacillus oceanisediminis]
MQAVSPFMQRTVIYSGSNSRAYIPDLFRGLGAKRVVLFSDRGLEKAGIVEKTAKIFESAPKGSGPELAGIYLEIAQDAESSSVNNAVSYAREVGADALLAVGGGSVLDTVKGVKYALHKGLSDIKTVIPKGILFEQFPDANHIPIPHIAMPTTAGTGSEVSPIAVIYNEDTKMKGNIINPYISSDIAVLDPELTVGLPAAITAFTGFDALTHAIEALASPIATALTDAHALQAIRLIEQNLPAAVTNGENIHARMEMLFASLMGITAFSCALNAIPVHNFAHAYGALFRIPHGLANAVFLPVVMEMLPDLYLPKITELAGAMNVRTGANEDREEVLGKVIEKLRLLQHNTGLPSDFSAYSLTEEGLKQAENAVEKDPEAAAFPIPKELIQAVGLMVAPIHIK